MAAEPLIAGVVTGGSFFVAVLVMARALRVAARLVRDREPAHPKKAPRGMGPCGVARVTYPMLRGLEVRELK